ncbi:LCP family protein [Bifidobacterium choerinum]|uniref:LCP family protein n=1 Tax=Bifidobacterium choerinum TaxID=35760 RepID=UPI00269344BA
MASHTAKKTREAYLGSSRKARPRHSAVAWRIRHRALAAVACVVAAALVFAGTAVASIWINLNNAVQEGAVKTVFADEEKLDPNEGRPIKFVLIGQDTRDDGNAELSGGMHDGEDGLHNADTTMVVDISAKRDFINIVSIPRDSIVDVPDCRTSDGKDIPAQYGVMFNSVFSTAYREGGDLSTAASCTVTAVNALTGMHITNFVVVDFKGLSGMIDAIGGVDVCIPVDTVDANTDMDLRKGMRHLDGRQATNYARMRHGTGTDGSDIMRTTRQQYLVKSLIAEAISKNMFTQTSELYQLALAAIRSLNISSGMADTNALVALALSLRHLDVSHVYAQTVPVVPAPFDPNRVVWADNAAEVWQRLRDDRPLYGDDAADASPAPESTAKDDADGKDKDDETTPTPEADDAATDTPSATPSAKPQPTVDPKTGLIKREDGTLIDPNTNGVVDPENGSIRDPETGQYIGIAYQYLNTTICSVPAKSE